MVKETIIGSIELSKDKFFCMMRLVPPLLCKYSFAKNDIWFDKQAGDLRTFGRVFDHALQAVILRKFATGTSKCDRRRDKLMR